MGNAFVFDGDSAMSADAGGFITTGGVYVGKIKNAVSHTSKGGAKAVEFELEADGATARYVKLYTRNRDGQKIDIGYGKIQALMGLLGVQQVTTQPTNESDIVRFPELVGQRIGFILRRKEYEKNDGGVGFNMEVLHWIDPDTQQTYSEKKKGIEAKAAKRTVTDLTVESGTQQYAPPANNETHDDELPF